MYFVVKEIIYLPGVFLLKKGSFDNSRVAGSNAVIRNIFYYYTSCSNDTPVPYSYTGTDNYNSPNPDVILDVARISAFYTCRPCFEFEGMYWSINLYIGADKEIFS